MAKHNHLAAPCDTHTKKYMQIACRGREVGVWVAGIPEIPSSHAICMKILAG